MTASLEIRVLGEVEILRGGKAAALPASKKTRALLGYLVLEQGRPQLRSRLCELFWDGPDDPRAALRWSLTKLRPLVDDAKIQRLTTDREHVAFAPRGALVDIHLLGGDRGSLSNAPLERLLEIARAFRGELLEGLDLPQCYRYHEWCVAQREEVRRLRGEVLATLADRLKDAPEKALVHARARVAIEPLSEAAHVVVMHLLAGMGRTADALKQYETCRRILETQLGRTASKELEVARARLGSAHPSASTPSAKPLGEGPRARLVGRLAEREAIAGALRAAADGSSRQVLMFAGEPGIGKTRLLEEVAARATAIGGSALFGRAFEAEMICPYGPWIDALRSAPPGSIDSVRAADLAPLLPELGSAQREIDRNRLFDAVSKWLAHRATSGPLVVVLDDLQWLDEASVALLHYAARALVDSRVLIACAGRASELEANRPVRALLWNVARDKRLLRIELGPLDAAATRELVAGVAGGVDAEQIFIDCGGNPLFSLELARALASGDGSGAAHTLDALIAERFSHVSEGATELLPWASALGHSFSLDTLASLTQLPVSQLLGAVEELERQGMLRVTTSALGSVGYDFAHDLVRRAAYRAMSEPRRRWVHLHIARTLSAASDPDGALSGDVAHHAALGGDSEVAARAYLRAGERSLRIFAHSDASRLAASGLQHLARLPPEEGIRLRLALLGVQVHSNQWLRRFRELENELTIVARAAEERGMHAEVARSFYLMSFIHNERGDLARARARSLRAAEAARAADAHTSQHHLANTGRCLALIERDVAGAEKLLREAQSLGSDIPATTALELDFGMGLIHAYKGNGDEAVRLLERAAGLAASQSDYWAQSQALTRLARMALEDGKPDEALTRCVALEPLVVKFSEGSEAPFVAALRGLARLHLGETGAREAVDGAVDALRSIDSRAHLAYVLVCLAEIDLREGRRDRASQRASEALDSADKVDQKSEAAVARALLARLAFENDKRPEARQLLAACGPDLAASLALSARARAAVLIAAKELGEASPELLRPAAPAGLSRA
jgi:DNA-binding SARP family transcriptional activator/tetratricopeptide (TPR) repeat protein